MKSYQGLLNIGYNNTVSKNKVVAVVSADTAPIRRLKDQARKENRLIDATNGKKTNSVIITDSNHVVLSALSPETLSLRARKNLESKKRRR